jgi:chromate transporter
VDVVFTWEETSSSRNLDFDLLMIASFLAAYLYDVNASILILTCLPGVAGTWQNGPEGEEKLMLFQLFLSFVQVGLFSVGGGYAAIPLIKSSIIDTHGWITLSEFTDLITIAEMTPGPIAVNAATFVGIKVADIPGAFVATFGCILPSCFIVSLLAYAYRKYHSLPLIQDMLSGLRPVVVALIASATISSSRWWWSTASRRLTGIVLMVAAFCLIHFRSSIDHRHGRMRRITGGPRAVCRPALLMIPAPVDALDGHRLEELFALRVQLLGDGTHLRSHAREMTQLGSVPPLSQERETHWTPRSSATSRNVMDLESFAKIATVNPFPGGDQAGTRQGCHHLAHPLELVRMFSASLLLDHASLVWARQTSAWTATQKSLA